MTPDAIAKAAGLLVSTRRTRKMLDALPADCRPGTAEDGYAIQKAFVAAWGEPVAGWKAGATAIAIQQRFGLTEPFLGPFFAPSVMASPARAPADRFEHRGPLRGAPKPGVGLEVEFAFRMGRDLAPGQGSYSEAQVLDAIDAMIPAFEIIAPRFHAIPFDNPGTAIADCGVNGGMVLGKPVTAWRGLDYASHKTRLVVDGRTVAEGTGALVLGHPFKSLTWLVNGVTKRGFGLSKGQILTTGSMTGIAYADQGATAIGDFGNLGKVEACFD